MTVIKIPLSWLNDFVEVSDLDPIEPAERLTLAGLEVEISAGWGLTRRSGIICRSRRWTSTMDSPGTG